MKTNIQHITNNMPFLNASSGFNAYECLIWAMLLSYMLSCFASFYNEVIYLYLLSGFIWLIAVAVICVSIHKRIYIINSKIYAFCLCFILWVILTYWIHNDYMMNDLYNRTFLISRCIMCFIALPLVHILNDRDNRHHLDAFLGIFISVTAIFLWLSYIGILRGANILLYYGKLSFGATYTTTDRMMLQFFNIHYYTTAYLALICFFITLYLAVSYWTAKRGPVFIFIMATFLIAVIITYSRTAYFTLLIGLMIAFLILLQELNLSRKAKCIILTVTSSAGIVITALVMNIVYKYFNSIRDIWYGISTLSSRTTIWSSVLDLEKDQPLAILHGLSLTNAMPVVNSYLDFSKDISHMHSGYLHALVTLGLPAFILTVAFCLYLLRASLRIIFSSEDNMKYPVKIKLMVIIPLCYIVINVFESLIFSNTPYTDIFNFIIMLFSGYIIEYAYPKTPKKSDDKNSRRIAST